MLCRPRLVEAAVSIPPNSASAELRHTVVWVFESALIGCAPRIATPPDVLRRVLGHPAKPVSVYVTISLVSSLPNLNRHTLRGLDTKYLRSLLSLM